MNTKSKETVYNEEIFHFMAQIIKICKDNKIAMLALFSLDEPDNEGLMCTTALLGEEFDPPPPGMRQALNEIMQPKQTFAALTISKEGDN